MYLTDLTDAKKEYIRGTILNENWRSKYDFFLMLDAIIYIDVSGCQWRLLPAEYPKWQTVYYYFRRWGAMYAFSEIEDSLVEQVRARRGEFPPAYNRGYRQRKFSFRVAPFPERNRRQ